MIMLRIHLMKPLACIAIALLAGCVPTQTIPLDDGQHMMIADIVPLAADEQPWQRGQPMAVPEEPSRFELRREVPVAMKSDLENARQATEKYETEPRTELVEPIP